MDTKRLLVIKARALGDTLLATPALHALRQGIPRARVTAVVSPQGAEVLAGNPDVDEVWVYDKRAPWGAQARFILRLRQPHFDLGVALHASWRTAFLLRMSGAPRRVVHNHSGADYFGTVPLTARKESKSSIERDLDAVRALGLPAAETSLVFPLGARDHQAARSFLLGQRLRPGQYFVLIPGAGKARKQWTAPTAAIFLKSMRRRFAAPWVLNCGPQDQDLCTQIVRALDFPVPVFSGNLHAAGALYARSRGVLTTDSGPKHVAVAVGARTLTLWTDEPEAEWHPYNRETHGVLRSPTGLVADIAAETAVQGMDAHFHLLGKKR